MYSKSKDSQFPKCETHSICAYDERWQVPILAQGLSHVNGFATSCLLCIALCTTVRLFVQSLSKSEQLPPFDILLKYFVSLFKCFVR